MKPNWKDAPEFAQYLAQDKDGWWYWYEKKPYADEHTWCSIGMFKAAQESCWENSLEERPND